MNLPGFLWIVLPVLGFCLYGVVSLRWENRAPRPARRTAAARKRARATRKALASMPAPADEAWAAFVAIHELDQPERKTP